MIAIASDHAGFEFKERARQLLDQLNLPYRDFGTFSPDPCDYPDFAYPAAKSVSTGECEKGIVICGSGIGASIVSNKVENVRAALCMTAEMAELSRRHNNANVLNLGGRLVPWDVAEEIIKVWLSTPFEGGRHERRIEKIHSLSGC